MLKFTMTNRQSLRSSSFDYSSNGWYFVTVCTDQKKCLFGNIRNDTVELNEAGMIVSEEWHRTAQIRKNVQLDSYVVMPNHFHGIIGIQNEEAEPIDATSRTLESGSLGAIIGQFKSIVTKRISRGRPTGSPLRVWQRNYYERVIRSEKAFNVIRLYIETNPMLWNDGDESAEKMSQEFSGDDLDLIKQYVDYRKNR